MSLERLKQAAAHVTGLGQPPHPFDPLSEREIEQAVAIVRKEYSNVFFNAITLWEPRKAEMMNWIKDPEHTVRPHRVADVVCIGKGSKVFDAIVDLTEGKIINWETTEGVQPLVWSFSGLGAGAILTSDADHNGGSTDCGEYRAERPQSYRAVWNHRYSTRGHAQGLLRS
jgi:Cu2+-containing amine oxidase